MMNALVSLPGATEEIVKFELFNVLNEFFQVTKAWKEDVTFEVTSENTEYDVVPGEPGAVDSLISVVDANEILTAATMPVIGVVKLSSAPSTSQEYTATYSLTVVDPARTDGYPQFPSAILNKYQNDILHGVLANMMAQPAKPYSSERLAIYHMRKFRSGMARARTETLHQNLYNGQTWRFPQYARGSQR